MKIFRSDETENISEMPAEQKRAFKKGIIFGILLTVCGILLAGNISMAYRMIFKKEINYVRKAREVYGILKNEYVDDFTKEELYDGIYLGMVANVTDKYSRYFNKKDYDSYTISTDGSYAGIGVNVALDENENTVFTKIYENSPAQKCGIAEGDRLLKVDGENITSENFSDITSKIRGKQGTNVTLTICRAADGAVVDVTLTRENVDVPTAAYAMLPKDIGYIKLSGFERVSAEQFEQAYNTLQNDGMKGLIIDLRGNPGGLLTSVTQIADILLPKGVITYTEDKRGKRDYVYSEDGEIEIPLVILVNGNSASASELLAAAVQDTGKGTIIGTNTYGKGVVQTTFSLTDGSAVKVTTAKYYTPNGVCIDGVGIKPDIETELDPDYILPDISGSAAAYDAERDNQLAEGIKCIENELNK